MQFSLETIIDHLHLEVKIGYDIGLNLVGIFKKIKIFCRWIFYYILNSKYFKFKENQTNLKGPKIYLCLN